MPPRITGKRTVAQSRLFEIEAVDLHFSNDVETSFERLLGSATGGVVVLPLLDADNLLVVEEYAVGLEHYELGFVKGLIDEGETVAAAAIRELEEEAGYTARQLDVLGNFSLMPQYSNFNSSIVVARQLTPKTGDGDEPEPLKCSSWPLNRLNALRQHERFTDSRSHLAVYLLEDFLRNLDQP